MAPALYRGDLVNVTLPGGLGRPPESPGAAAQLAWIDALELVEGRQVGAWVYPVYAGILDRRQRYYFARSRLTWTGLATDRVPGRIRRAWYALARALALAQLPDAPDWGAEAPPD